MTDIRKTIAEIKEGLECITPDLVERAAVTWCSTKERETFPEDIAYFRANWDNFNSFRKLVEREKDICRRHTMRAIIEHVEELQAESVQYDIAMARRLKEVDEKDIEIKRLRKAMESAMSAAILGHAYAAHQKLEVALNTDNRGGGDG